MSAAEEMDGGEHQPADAERPGSVAAGGLVQDWHARSPRLAQLVHHP